MSADNGWYDDEAGPLVRPYAITSGRTPADSARLDLSTIISALRSEQDVAGLGPEHLEVLRLCRVPISVAEISAYVEVPLGVIRVLVGDLTERGLVVTRSPSYRPASAQLTQTADPDMELLEAVLNGIRNL